MPLQQIAQLLASYTKIRQIVREARASKWTRGKLSMQLRVACYGKEVPLLRNLSKRLTGKAGLKWGNVAKKHDVVGRLLKRHSPKKCSKKRWDQVSLKSFIT